MNRKTYHRPEVAAVVLRHQCRPLCSSGEGDGGEGVSGTISGYSKGGSGFNSDNANWDEW